MQGASHQLLSRSRRAAHQDGSKMGRDATYLVEQVEHARTSTYHTLEGERGQQLGVKFPRAPLLLGRTQRARDPIAKLLDVDRLKQKFRRSFLYRFERESRRVLVGKNDDLYSRIEGRDLLQ